MPPRKRARASEASTPLRETQPRTPVDRADDEKDEVMEDVYDPIADPWTDEQETQLLRGLMRWKPTGIHKHFVMTRLAPSIHQDSVYRTLKQNLAAAPHTRIPGIWDKLGQLYNLDGLDAREDARTLREFDPLVWEDDIDAPQQEASEAEAEEEEGEHHNQARERPWNEVREYSLDMGDFGEMMWAKRFSGPPNTAPGKRSSARTTSAHGSESPPFFGWDNQRTMPSHLDAGPPEGFGENTTPKKGSARSRSAAATRSRRGPKGSKAQSEEVEDQGEGGEEGEEDDDEGEEEEEGEEGEEEENEEDEDEEPPESSPEKIPAKRPRGRPPLSARRSTRNR